MLWDIAVVLAPFLGIIGGIMFGIQWSHRAMHGRGCDCTAEEMIEGRVRWIMARSKEGK